jgi:two-component system sensor histidine kinase PilS (NtrC family)
LRSELERLGQLHRLNCLIHGDATVFVQEYVLDSVFDNILKNYADLALRHEDDASIVVIHIEKKDAWVEITLESQHHVPTPQIERLFEPFWGSDPAGLGIGLYQAKHLLEQNRGTLSARRSVTGGLQFHMTCAL